MVKMSIRHLCNLFTVNIFTVNLDHLRLKDTRLFYNYKKTADYRATISGINQTLQN